jgi:beta-glucanase (GH16 family)
MKVLLCLFLFPFCLSAQNYSLVWADEFDGPTLDGSKWVAEIGTGNGGWGNNELQYYTTSTNNVFIDTGYLNIVGRAESVGGANFTSSRIKTQGLYDFQYGRVEARMKVPVGQGLWPAFWMLGSNITTVGWPLCGEIDVMEHVNNELIIHGTHHYDYFGHTYDGGQAWADASIFHVYSIEWTANEIIWFLDGVEFYQTDIGPSSISKEEFHTPFFLLLNLAIGGNWPGSPNGTTTFPATMCVDYVRVYQETNELTEQTPNLFTLSPNPANDVLTINAISDLKSYTITNLQGEHLLTGDTNVIDVNSLTPGVYFVQVTMSEGNQSTVRFVKN